MAARAAACDADLQVRSRTCSLSLTSACRRPRRRRCPLRPRRALSVSTGHQAACPVADAGTGGSGRARGRGEQHSGFGRADPRECAARRRRVPRCRRTAAGVPRRRCRRPDAARPDPGDARGSGVELPCAGLCDRRGRRRPLRRRAARVGDRRGLAQQFRAGGGAAFGKLRQGAIVRSTALRLSGPRSGASTAAGK